MDPQFCTRDNTNDGKERGSKRCGGEGGGGEEESKERKDEKGSKVAKGFSDETGGSNLTW